MPTIESGDVHLYTYRTGLLSAVGHDLRLSVGRFEISWDNGEVTGRFWPESIEVDGSVEDGQLQPGEPKPSDKKKIYGNIQEDVLKSNRHPEIRFEGGYREVETEPGDETTYEVAGELEIRGVEEAIELRLHEQEGRFRAELELEPSRWGIEPYSALLGSLKLQDRVTVELDLSSEAAERPSGEA
jgi:hypothetical protein